ncbi:multiple epidermal growth factor-like domains protein 10 isoform X2 [Saccostrea cucullata]|uniref:multiple epidermal growth factor-like domains protein 10 isoform X2 n=1 Tax=Saccostrea cuccullata TaxID=36930 RepID=UPI002ED0A335
MCKVLPKSCYVFVLFIYLAGEVNLKNLSKSMNCSLGHVGGHCELPCRYPSYGNYCQKKCYCKKEYCDHVSGCRDCQPGSKGKGCEHNCTYPNYGVYCRSTCDCLEEECDYITGCEGKTNECTLTKDRKSSETMLSGTIVLGFIAVIQFILYVYLSIFYRPQPLYITHF